MQGRFANRPYLPAILYNFGHTNKIDPTGQVHKLLKFLNSSFIIIHCLVRTQTQLKGKKCQYVECEYICCDWPLFLSYGICNKVACFNYIVSGEYWRKMKTQSITIREHFEQTGNWLFHRRSYLPMVCFIIIIVSLQNFKYPYGSHRLDQLWEVFCLTISLSGLAIRILTVGYVPDGTSGRNTKGQKAYVLNTTGMYSLLRHPLYLGNFLVWLGVSMFARFWWLTLIMILSYWLYYERIVFAEEKFLQQKFGQQFTDWAKKTRIFLPKLSSWKKPARPFSLRMVLKREHSTVFLIILLFFAMEEAASLITTGSFEWDIMWFTILAAGSAQYMLFRTLKKHTTLLRNAD